ncbi:hypothetical protein GEMRC1_012117 [Eukaryota sp. GEM-RC1]
MSDLVTLRTWVPVQPPHFYHPMLRIPLFRLMKTQGELRNERNRSAPVKQDSLYLPIEREEKVFNPLVIPKSLQAELPFASKPKLQQKRVRKGVEQRRPLFRDEAEVERQKLLEKLRTSANDKLSKQKEKGVVDRQRKQKVKDREDEARAVVTRKRKAERMADKQRKQKRFD